jgi:hypothetical protein
MENDELKLSKTTSLLKIWKNTPRTRIPNGGLSKGQTPFFKEALKNE